MSYPDKSEPSINHTELPTAVVNSVPKLPTIDFDREFERLASLVAESWKDSHLDSQSSETDFDQCVEYVTAEMVKAGTAVKGPAGYAVVSGGGYRAACKVCRRVLEVNESALMQQFQELSNIEG